LIANELRMPASVPLDNRIPQPDADFVNHTRTASEALSQKTPVPNSGRYVPS
jgi:hypothetical protein